MPEKPPAFVVTDRRKFTSEGELREGAPTDSREEETRPVESVPAPQAATREPAAGPRLVTMPAPPEPAPEVVDADFPEAELDLPEGQEGFAPEPTAQESADQHAAYRQSSRDLDSMLRQANPGMAPTAEVTIEHVIQSIYLSAVVAMGAATEPGQKPRVDILGARQSIDMLAVLSEKTKGNLNEKEQRLLQSALFELRMMFLEITNAIAQQAQKPPQGKK